LILTKRDNLDIFLEEDNSTELIKGESLPLTIQQTNELAKRGSKKVAFEEYFKHHARRVDLENPYVLYR